MRNVGRRTLKAIWRIHTMCIRVCIHVYVYVHGQAKANELR